MLGHGEIGTGWLRLGCSTWTSTKAQRMSTGSYGEIMNLSGMMVKPACHNTTVHYTQLNAE